MNKKVYIALPQEAAEYNQRFITKLHYDHKRVPNETAYNSCQLSTSVKGDADWQHYSFPRSRRIGAGGALIGMLLIAASLFIALDQGLFDWAAFLFQ